MKPLPIYCVDWRDASLTTGWQTLDGVEHGTSENHTVGYLVEKTRKHIALAQSLATTGNGTELVDAIMTIPRDWVIRMKRLK